MSFLACSERGFMPQGTCFGILRKDEKPANSAWSKAVVNVQDHRVCRLVIQPLVCTRGVNTSIDVENMQRCRYEDR